MQQALGQSLSALIISLGLSGLAQADIINFEFTGRMTVADPVSGQVFYNYDENDNRRPYTPIAATLSYNTASGLGSSGLAIELSENFLGIAGYLHDISMTLQEGGNLIAGQVFVDWGGVTNTPAHIEWDATGLLNALDYGLQVGDKLSGTRLFRDYNGDGVWDDTELVVADLGSATPYADTLLRGPGGAIHRQGPAPLAATSGSLGFEPGTPFDGLVVYLDIGSGNSMYVTSVTAVPVPAAAWLLGSGIVGLFGWSWRRNA